MVCYQLFVIHACNPVFIEPSIYSTITMCQALLGVRNEEDRQYKDVARDLYTNSEATSCDFFFQVILLFKALYVILIFSLNM